jgi:hypothetical protein
VRALGYYPEERELIIGGCGYRIIGDAAGADTGLRDVNPVTCRRHQWLAFYLRPLPQY